MVSQRHLARIAAVQSIFTLLCRSEENISKVLEYTVQELSSSLTELDFARSLVEGVVLNKKDLEQLVLDHSNEHSLDKIDVLTLSILLLGVFELKFSKNTLAPAIIINEAIEIAKEFGKDSSPRFVNAVLSKLVKEEK